ncbi:MAG: class I SAM-dependent methyltransferase [Turicibacter sp.]|nr:class I SAM-dependent methyltransferase [Turicibacter sp.]
MIITTAFDETEALVRKAKSLSESLNILYVPRSKKTVKFLLEHIDSQVFVINNQRGLSYYELGQEEVFFHPNMAMHRMKQIKNGQLDSLVTACRLKEGMTFLDCTLGLASDTLVANYVVGPTGKVISLEKSFPLAILVKEGLKHYAIYEKQEWKDVMNQVSIIQIDNLEYLKKCPDKSIDVVYFDFMFNHSIEKSHGIKIIKPIVSYDVMTKQHVKEAIRVAKERVVVKSSYGNLFIQELGFEMSRQNQKRHFFYGVIELANHEVRCFKNLE